MPRPLRATGPTSIRSASCAAKGSRRRVRAAAEAPKRRYSGVVQRALDTLGLDESANAKAIKAQYKSLVKQFHGDAHGGDRSFEERLRDIIRAHDTLKAAGLGGGRRSRSWLNRSKNRPARNGVVTPAKLRWA